MKTYRLRKNFKASFNFIVGGQEVHVLFNGGLRSPLFRRGYFCTTDINLQKAMESQTYFNVDYYLETDSMPKETIQPVKEENIVPVVVAAEPIVVPEITPVNIAPEPIEGSIAVPEVTTWMQAASYFRKQYPDKFNNTMKKADVLKAMEEYKISFPAWKH